MLTIFGDRWVEALEALDADWSSTIVLAGDGAAGLAEACMRTGSPPIAAEGRDWVVLAAGEIPDPPSRWEDLAFGIAGLVVLRRAWSGAAALGPAVAAGAGRVAPGGRLVVADLDVERLLGGSTVHYPYRLRFLLDPRAEQALRASTVSPSMLALETMRAGMRRVTGVSIDEERGRFEEPSAYWQAARDGGWASLEDMPPDERAPLLEAVGRELARVAPMGEIVERRPWFAATGIAP